METEAYKFLAVIAVVAVLGIAVFAMIFPWGALLPEIPEPGPEPSGAPQFNVIVLGWDGAQRDHLRQCYNLELQECSRGLPNLKQLSGGKIFNITATNGGLDTKAGWVQVLSGYNAEITGVFDNGKYRPIPEGFSVFEKLRKEFGSDIFTLFVTAKPLNEGTGCSLDKGPPWCVTKKSIDLFEDGINSNDKVVEDAAKALEENKGKSFFAFLQFSEPDRAGHAGNENSIAYSDKIVENDRLLGELMEKLKQIGAMEKTFIYVTADHGFDENTNRHHDAPYVFLATNDPAIVRNGDRKDIAPTILKKYGIILGGGDFVPPVDGGPLDSPLAVGCIAERSAFIDYDNAPACCGGLSLINLSKFNAGDGGCLEATGGTGDDSGYCTACGNGKCDEPENKCNCPADCK